MKEVYMREHRKIFTLGAMIAAMVLAGCASQQPAPPATTAMVVVPVNPPTTIAKETKIIRSGTVVAIQDTSTAAASGQGSSGSSTQSGASSANQLLTIQFDDGTRQQYQLTPTPGGQQFRTGDRVTVDSTQDTVLISH
jgi:hypothetical protein